MHRQCQDCGAGYGSTLFLWVADSLWKEMGCKPEDFFCADCTVRRLEKIRSYVYAVDGVGTHHVKGSGTKIVMEQGGVRKRVPVYPLGQTPIVVERALKGLPV